MRQVFFALLLLSCLAACDEPLTPQEEIDKYLDDNNLTAEKTASGLHYIIDEPGVGDHPTLADSVEVGYRGIFPDGEEFDQSDRIVFRLDQVIEGWQEGIPLFKRGGKGKLLIPPSLGYGSRGIGNIPGNAVLIFDIELFDFY